MVQLMLAFWWTQSQVCCFTDIFIDRSIYLFIYQSIYQFTFIFIYTCLSIYSSLSIYLYICVLQSHVYTYHLPCASTLSPVFGYPNLLTLKMSLHLSWSCWLLVQMLGMVQRIYPSIFPCVKLQGSAQVKNVKGMQGLQEIWETVYLSIYIAIF